VIGRHPSPVVRTVGALLAPFIMLFGIYVTAHGHYAPGGGFSGGVVIAVGVILLRVTADPDVSFRHFPLRTGVLAASIGMGLFVLVALAPLVAAGAFLDYGHLAPAAVDPAALRYIGILIVELAIGLAVFGALLLIFDALVGERLGVED
jgi:multicomponent Na+:H+ antiporter subunit B